MSLNNVENPVIVWFRQDLRLTDNPALASAAQSGKPIIALFINDSLSPDLRPLGGAQKWWLHHSLEDLQGNLRNAGIELTLRSGVSIDVISKVQSESQADAIVWNRRYGEAEQLIDKEVKLNFDGEAKSYAGLIMHEPSLVRTGAGNPYRVYTPFWKNFSSGHPPRRPLKRPEKLNPFTLSVDSDGLDTWELHPTQPDWSVGLAEEWAPGETGAQIRLDSFIKVNIDQYETMRDFPGPDRTSKLSPHLRFGEISPYQLWHASFSRDARTNLSDSAREKWRKELVWREFAYHLLQEWPDLAETNFNRAFDTFPWELEINKLKAWQTGQTGYPIVDAGMRQLYQTGWMHNRVRMIVGSFLVKHLLIDWRHGEKWFWDTLVDGDPASNPASWQWVAGTGADAAPYFRVFNPILQAKKFDPSGQYIKKYVPELSNLPSEHLPAPWEASKDELKQANIMLGKDYPFPIVDHTTARNAALEALNLNKQSSQEN